MFKKKSSKERESEFCSPMAVCLDPSLAFVLLYYTGRQRELERNAELGKQELSGAACPWPFGNVCWRERREFIRKRLWDRLMLVGEELSWNRSNQSLISDIRKLGHWTPPWKGFLLPDRCGSQESQHLGNCNIANKCSQCQLSRETTIIHSTRLPPLPVKSRNTLIFLLYPSFQLE